MKSLAGWCVALAFGLGVAGRAHAADDPKESARRHYEAGAGAMRQGDYEHARAEFEAAYAAFPNFRVLYDIGEAELGLGLAEPALAAFERFLGEGGEQVPAKQREQVEQQIAQLELGFASLEVVTEPTGATVTLDGSDLGKTPLEHPRRVRAGAHVVVATRPGAAPVSRVVTLSGRQHERVALALPDLPPPVAAPLPAAEQPTAAVLAVAAPRPVETHVSRFSVGYVLIGAGLIAGGAAATEAAWNHGRVERFRANQAALQAGTATNRTEGVTQNNSLADSINRASVVTVGLGVAAGALVVGGVMWLLLEPGAGTNETRASARLATYVPELAVSRDALAAAWSGTW